MLEKLKLIYTQYVWLYFSMYEVFVRIQKLHLYDCL